MKYKGGKKGGHERSSAETEHTETQRKHETDNRDTTEKPQERTFAFVSAHIFGHWRSRGRTSCAPLRSEHDTRHHHQNRTWETKRQENNGRGRRRRRGSVSGRERGTVRRQRKGDGTILRREGRKQRDIDTKATRKKRKRARPRHIGRHVRGTVSKADAVMVAEAYGADWREYDMESWSYHR